MKKVSIIVHQDYLEEVVRDLHEKGLMQIIDISKEEPEGDFERGTSHPEAETLANYELRLSRLIDILRQVTPKKGGVKAILNPDLPKIKQIEDLSIDELYSYSEGILDEIEKKIIEKKEELDKLNEEEENIKNQLEQIKYLDGFDLDISDIKESEYLVLKAGITTDFDELNKEIKKLNLTEIYEKSFGSGKKIKWSVVIVGHISEKEKIEKITRENLDEFNLHDLSGIPDETTKLLKQNIKDIDKKKKNIITELRKESKKQLDELLSLREEIQIERARKEISKNFTKTNYTYSIKGWILEKDENILEKSINNISKERAICNFKTPSQNPDNPPTYLKTPRWAEGFKGLLSMFSLPKYNEIDPTIIMGIFFVLFFGFMLGDAGYGSIIFFLSIFGYLKFSKHSDMIRSWSFMGIWLGLTTVIVGLLTNSFFGDLVTRFIYGDENALLYEAKIFGINLPLNSIKDPLTILTIALIFGLIHLNVGIVLGIIQEARRKNYKKLLTEQSCWIPLQIGGGLLIGYFMLDFQISSTLMYIASILTIIGIIQLFAGKGPIGFFDITGYVGDWLSYARLLALGLATAGMALAFNVVSQMLQPKAIDGVLPVILIIVMIILLVILHVVNLGLQALGAGVHSLRLQYVEFFNRFYEGGGKEFTPFKIKRKYTKKIDEK